MVAIAVLIQFVVLVIIFLVMALFAGFSLTSILVASGVYLISVWLLTSLTQAKCKYCDSAISKKAVKCPKCQSDLLI
ncbi:hypothetical protein DMW06_24885 [Vibrio parahaemolyticus]|nr:hypothetical protein [Vibrio parahaemolyticus]